MRQDSGWRGCTPCARQRNERWQIHAERGSERLVSRGITYVVADAHRVAVPERVLRAPVYLRRRVARRHILRATTRQALNSEEAIEQYQLHHPDLVLMDLRMPVMGGLAATRAIITDGSDRTRAAV